MCKTPGSREIAFFVFLIATFISKTSRPEKVAILGNWISALGETLEAMGETEIFLNELKQEKIKEIDEINNQMKELQKRLDQLKC